MSKPRPELRAKWRWCSCCDDPKTATNRTSWPECGNSADDAGGRFRRRSASATHVALKVASDP
eukprot:8325945-Pyramimonas_sp.AAC.1